ncbi:MAG: type IV secretion system DNA-binding domain-containing protein [Candidatus Taylorbacteria bacterium]
MDENRITYFAETDARNKKVKFGIKAKDRTRHVYVIGKTGMGKSTLLENMAVQDIQNGEGLCFIDPHGKTADLLLEYVPKERIKDVIMIAPFDTEYPISFNVLESVDPEKRHLVVSGLMSTFKKIWVDAWSARMEYILTNTLLALLECPGSTLLGVNKMLSDKEYRKEVVAQVKDPSVRTFWVKEFANYTERMAAEAVPSIQNKVGQFTANPLIRNMIGQPVSSFDFRQAMDSRKIIIINLSKGRIGDENMKLLGGLLVTKIYLAAMSRADVPDRVMKTLPNFYLFVDEFQNFANASFADILSEARKYKLNLTIAHQYVEQMDEFVRPAIFGNIGTMMVFRVGATDAEFLEKEFAPQFEIEDLVNLGFAQVYLKLMIDGLTSSPFSATTLPPIPHPDISFVKEITDSSRAQFSHPRAQVEESIIKFHESAPKAPVAPKTSVAPKTPVFSAPKAPSISSIPSTPALPPKVATVIPPKAPAAPSLSPHSSPKPQPAPIAQQVSKPLPQYKPNIPATPKPLNIHVPRTDQKTPTAQNVGALKNALAAAMAKASAEKSQTPPKAPPGTATPPVATPASTIAPTIAPTITPAATQSKEVPEDVLNKVFKID